MLNFDVAWNLFSEVVNLISAVIQGFGRRKFPRESYSTRCSGSHGVQITRRAVLFLISFLPPRRIINSKYRAGQCSHLKTGGSEQGHIWKAMTGSLNKPKHSELYKSSPRISGGWTWYPFRKGAVCSPTSPRSRILDWQFEGKSVSRWN